MDTIGARVKETLRGRGLSQAELARSIDLGESALSKSLNGTRAFSAVELAEVADRIGVSMHWLVTGEPDPYELRLVARHDYDHSCRETVRLLRASHSSTDRRGWRERA